MLTYDEAIMLRYLNGMPCGKEIRNYMYERFGYKINIMAEEFVRRGLFRTSTVEENLEKATANQLKDLLKEYGQKVSGKKAELVERVIANVPYERLENEFNDNFYVLTSEGKTIFDKYEAVYICEDKHLELDHKAIISEIKENSTKKAWQIIEILLKERVQDCASSNSLRIYGITCRQLAQLYLGNNEYNKALFYAYAHIFIDLTGILSFHDGRFHLNSFFYKYKHAVYPDEIEECLYKLNMSTEDFLKLVPEFIEQLPKLPFSYYTPETVAQMIVDKINGKEDVEYPIQMPVKNHPDYDWYGYDENSEEYSEPVKEDARTNTIIETPRITVSVPAKPESGEKPIEIKQVQPQTNNFNANYQNLPVDNQYKNQKRNNIIAIVASVLFTFFMIIYILSGGLKQ